MTPKVELSIHVRSTGAVFHALSSPPPPRLPPLHSISDDESVVRVVAKASIASAVYFSQIVLIPSCFEILTGLPSVLFKILGTK